MMAPAKKKSVLKNWWDDRVKTPFGLFSYRAVIVLCLCSYTPLGQSGMDKVGLKTANVELVAIKDKIQNIEAKQDIMGTKVDSLVTETERLKLEAERLALRFRIGPIQPN